MHSLSTEPSDVTFELVSGELSEQPTETETEATVTEAKTESFEEETELKTDSIATKQLVFASLYSLRYLYIYAKV